VSPVVHDIHNGSAKAGKQRFHLTARQPVYLHAGKLAQLAHLPDHRDHRDRQDLLQPTTFNDDRKRVVGGQLKHQDAARAQDSYKLRQILPDVARRHVLQHKQRVHQVDGIRLD